MKNRLSNKRKATVNRRSSKKIKRYTGKHVTRLYNSLVVHSRD